MLDLDRDPVPGDPFEVKELARKLGDFADDVASALRSVKGLNGDTAVQEWAGLSGDAYRSQFGELPGRLDKLERSYRLASGALEDYWPKLETAQADADRALAQGRTARQELDSAQSQLTNADAWVKRAQDKSKSYQDDPKPNVPPPSAEEVRAAARNATDANNAHTTASTAVHNAQAKLDAAKQLAADAAQLRDDAASTAQHALHEASDAGIKNKHWWEKAVDWVADHWDDIIAVCKVIVAVLGIVVLIIGGPLAWLVLAAAVLVLADTVMKYLQGKASLWDVLFAALDCIPMFKGLTTAGGLLKMARELPALLKSGRALENIANSIRKGAEGLKNLKDIVPSLRKGAQDEVKAGKAADVKCFGADPIDLITGEVFRQERDVELPGLLPLVLTRTHLSDYRSGMWFGPSWASTLDQRLELDAEGVVFAAEDGMMLVYPVPRPGVATYPTQGPLWPLLWDGTPGSVMTVTDPFSGRTRHFTAVGGQTGTGTGTAAGPMALPLSAMTDRNGHRIDIDRTKDGVPTAVNHSGGYRVDVSTGDGRVTALTMADGTRLRGYDYNDAGDLAEVTDAAGSVLTLTYDDEHRLTQWRDSGGWYEFTYDGEGRCIRGRGADGYLDCAISYKASDRTTEYTDSLGHRTRYRYNELLQVTSVTDPLGHEVRSTWNHRNQLLSRTDPLGGTLSCGYDARGNLTSVVRVDGTTVELEYNDLNRAVRADYPGGLSWTHTWDERGNLLETTGPDGGRRRYSYDDRGHLSSVVDPSGAVWRSTADSAGLITMLEDPTGGTTRYTRDGFGRVVEMTESAAGTTRIEWHANGKPAARVFPDASVERWAYDAEGLLVAHTNVSGTTTRYGHDRFALRSDRTAPDGTELRFSYDTELRLRSVTNAVGAQWSYTYDPAGRLVAETDFNGRVLQYAHDAAGRLSGRVNSAGQEVRFDRDAMGRLITRTDGGLVESFAYDDGGRLVRAANAATELTIDRDAIGRPTAETCNGRTLRHVFDELGRRIGRITPEGVRSSWDWRSDGLPARLRSASGTIDFGYDELGRETERSVGDGLRLTQRWDGHHRLTEQLLRTADEVTVQRRTYAYRADGYAEAVGDLLSGDREFDLDAAGRITAVRSDDWTQTYAYDAAGNLALATAGDGSGDADRVSAAAGPRDVTGTLVRRAGRTHYDYDGQGRLVRRTVRLLSGGSRSWDFHWSADDRLTQVRTPDGSTWNYVYDALGRRTAKERRDGDGRLLDRTDFTWDGGRLCEQVSAEGSLTWDWAPGTHRALSQVQRVPRKSGPDSGGDGDEQAWYDERFYAIVTDLVGMPTELVDGDGAVAWRQRSTPWGEASEPPQGYADCPLRFPGQYFDAETGLHYNLFRFYAPETAAYISPDPLGLAPAPNHHAYVLNPLAWIDPLGLACGDPVPSYMDQKAKALRDAGVPEGQEPLEVRYVYSTGPSWQGSPKLFDANHQPIMFREEDHLTDSGDLVTFQDHWTGHREPGDPGHQPPHVHVRPHENPRNGQLPGVEEHYYYDPALGKPADQ
ncbi:DUF6531 domain-containing protein [Actinacidiphila alni]|uniref:DUF6531 domain-containing protein n=1 Tax=Actinacidiphila alni TaxID=380248 RepID=UPI0034539DE4